jgi:hypothetical protein
MGQPLRPRSQQVDNARGHAARAQMGSALLVNVDNDTLRRIMDNPYASGDGRG